jgi:hypothetical protein
MTRKPIIIGETEKKLILAPPPPPIVQVPASALSDLELALLEWGQNPVQAVKDIFNATPEDYQGDMLNDVFVNGEDRLAGKSAHGTGKTTVLSWMGWIFLMTRPMSRVLATAPVQAQLRDVLWPEFSKWHGKMNDRFKNMFTLSSEHIRCKAAPMDWFAVGRTSNKPENVQGFHNTYLMIIIDEASGVPAPVFEVMEGALSDAGKSGGESKLVMMGNPNFTSGELYDAFNKNKDLYARYTLSGDGETQFGAEDGKVYVSNRVSEKYRRNIARKYGKGAIYDVRVRGVFPKLDDTAVIPLAWAMAAQQVELPSFDPVADGVIIACDPARYGDDETTIAVIRKGHVIKLEAYPKTSTWETASLIDTECQYWEEQGIAILDIRVDEPGVGGGVIDILRMDPAQEGEQQGGFGRAVTAYNGGKGLVQGVDPDDEIRMFLNRRARDFWKVRRLVEQGLCHWPEDEELPAQAATLKFEVMENQKIRVESKKMLKARLGVGSSPDRIDVIVIGLADFYSMADETVAGTTEDEIIKGRQRDRLDDRVM